MLKSYKYRLYPTPKQKELLDKHFGARRFIYNLALETKRAAYYPNKVKLSCYDLIRQLTPLKEDAAWLRDISTSCMQQTIVEMDAAYIKWMRGECGVLRYRTKRSKQTYKVTDRIKVDFENGILFMPKFRKKNGIKCIADRTYNGDAKSLHISKTTTGKYFASILVDVPTGKGLAVKHSINNAIGIDLGLKDFAITSDGEVISNPMFLKNNIDRLKVLQRRAAKKQKGSANKAKANLKVARHYEKITNRRSDFLHKLSSRLIDENQGGTICLETLNVKGMMKNHKLAGAIGDVSWSEFVRQLIYKGDWYGVNILRIGRFEPSSKTCTCGVVNKELTLKDRVWTCKHCGATHDRDVLAANNIKKFAFKNLENSGSGWSGELVEMLSIDKSTKQEDNLLIVK